MGTIIGAYKNISGGNPNIKNIKKGGRPRGAKNKVFMETKFNLKKAVKMEDGNELKFLRRWYKEEPSTFRVTYAKAMIPKEQNIQGDVNVNFTWIKDDTADHGPL